MKSTPGTRASGSMNACGAALAAQRRLIGPLEARTRATRIPAPTAADAGRTDELAA